MDSDGSFFLLVPAKARPVPSNGLLVVGIGEPVTLTCEVTGNPVPVVTWTREVRDMTFCLIFSRL